MVCIKITKQLTLYLAGASMVLYTLDMRRNVHLIYLWIYIHSALARALADRHVIAERACAYAHMHARLDKALILSSLASQTLTRVGLRDYALSLVTKVDRSSTAWQAETASQLHSPCPCATTSVLQVIELHTQDSTFVNI